MLTNKQISVAISNGRHTLRRALPIPDRPMKYEDDEFPEVEEPEFLLAFGPADHHYESDDGDEACSYVLGYN